MNKTTNQKFYVHATITIPVSIKINASNEYEALENGAYQLEKWIEKQSLESLNPNNSSNPKIYDYNVEVESIYDEDE